MGEKRRSGTCILSCSSSSSLAKAASGSDLCSSSNSFKALRLLLFFSTRWYLQPKGGEPGSETSWRWGGLWERSAVLGRRLPETLQIPGRKGAALPSSPFWPYPRTGQGRLQRQGQDPALSHRAEPSDGTALLLALDLLLSPGLGFVVGLHDPSLL